MTNKLPIFIVVVALLFASMQFFYLPQVVEVDWYSFFSEGVIAITLLVLVFNLHDLRSSHQVYQWLLMGAILLFLSLWTDALDELFEHPKWLTTIFEDLFQLVGFIMVLVGIQRWIKLNNRLHARLKQQATTDELTGLAVRRHFNEKAEQEFKRCRRNQGLFSILLIDIDHFKQVNDCYGHACGDEVLKVFAQTMKECQRGTDVVARWGGEEFIILAIESDQEACAQAAEKLRQKTENLSLKLGENTIRFTISIGGAVLKRADRSIDEIINRADERLYQAKRSGRNRFCIEDFS